LIPSIWLRDADSLLFALIVQCQTITEADLFTVDDHSPDWEVDENDVEIRKTLTGLILGLTDSKFKRLDRSKDVLETARTLVFSMRVKHEFANNPKLGLGALKKNNYYFGNNPKEVVKIKEDPKALSKKRRAAPIAEVKIMYEWSTIISRLFKSPLAQNFFDKLIHKSTYLLKLDNFTDDEYNKTISKLLLTYDDVVKKFSRPLFEINSRTKKKTIKKYRLPEKPSRPSLLLKEEFHIVTMLISSVWSSSAELKRNWHYEIMENSFSDIEKYLSSIYSERWRLIEAIARVTKARLEAIRKTDARYVAFKKADITPEILSAYLTSRTNQIGDFYLEIKSIIGKDLPLATIKALLPVGTYNVTNLQSEGILKNCILEQYRTGEVAALKAKFANHAAAGYEFNKLSDQDITRIANLYDRALNISVRVERLSRINWNKHAPINLYLRVRELLALEKSLEESRDSLEGLKREEVEAIEYIRRSVPNTEVKFDKNHSIFSILHIATVNLGETITKIRSLPFGDDLMDSAHRKLESKEVSALLGRKAQKEALSKSSVLSKT
jgi:hypothetical protein